MKDNSVDGIICTLATHHFRSLEESFREMWRVLSVGSNFVIFTADPRLVSRDCWLRKYFGVLFKKAGETLPLQSEVANLLEEISGTPPKVISFRLPADMKDSFFYSAWRHPERYLDQNFRKGISLFAYI